MLDETDDILNLRAEWRGVQQANEQTQHRLRGISDVPAANLRHQCTCGLNNNCPASTSRDHHMLPSAHGPQRLGKQLSMRLVLDGVQCRKRFLSEADELPALPHLWEADLVAALANFDLQRGPVCQNSLSLRSNRRLPLSANDRGAPAPPCSPTQWLC